MGQVNKFKKKKKKKTQKLKSKIGYYQIYLYKKN